MADSDEDVPLSILRKKELSDDDVPLSKIINKERACDERSKKKKIQLEPTSSSSDETSEYDYDYDSDKDPAFNPGQCEVKRCKEEVFAACPECELLLCYDHISEDVTSCEKHGFSLKKKATKKRKQAPSSQNRFPSYPDQTLSHSTKNHFQPDQLIPNSERSPHDSEQPLPQPEDFIVEGSEREAVRKKKLKGNKQKEAKRKRSLGQEYVSPSTKKKVCKKAIKPRCKHLGKGRGDVRRCFVVSEEHRETICREFYELGDLALQREFIVRHIKCVPKTQSTTADGASRREKTNEYYLTINHEMVQVCKVLFLNTLAVSEQATRTALKKLTSVGTMEKEQRGGVQSQKVLDRNNLIREAVSKHIDRFPRVESHYCRRSTTMEYLCEDLTKKRMYNMFLAEWGTKPDPPKYAFYKSVFKEKNLSIHKPKKDQCSLCNTYRLGDEETKEKLHSDYTKHIEEKQRVRDIKESAKQAAIKDETILCANFDLQQVLYLPISKESAIFYKRRLSNYNLTFYNLANRKCHCFHWDETASKRGASEISTAVFKALQHYDNLGAKKAYLFSDGCSGQNKNSIVPAMMLYLVSQSKNLEDIALSFFVTNHGQSEGDSAHSAIATAVQSAGDIFLPSQLLTVFTLARANKPYLVEALQWEDFLDFKSLAKELRILDARKDSNAEEIVWSDIMEMRVFKQHPDTVFVKTSHLDIDYTPLSLKRLQKKVKDHNVSQLNSGPNNISKEKYSDLVSLCSGQTPVIRMREHKNFYMSLPHY